MDRWVISVSCLLYIMLQWTWCCRCLFEIQISILLFIYPEMGLLGRIANTLFQQHKRKLHMDITRWSTPKSDWLYSLQQRWRSSIQSTKTRPGADCGSDHELLIAKFRLKLKKIGKTTRLFSYDLNQIPYDYTLEVRNRFKGLDLIDRVPDELWTEVRDIVLETGIKTTPMEKQNGCLGRPYK